jgi:hypothetical protein
MPARIAFARIFACASVISIPIPESFAIKISEFVFTFKKVLLKKTVAKRASTISAFNQCHSLKPSEYFIKASF